MKHIMGMYTWLNVATSGIRFGPDRNAVRAELQEHIEDKTLDLLRIFPDMDEAAAGERALASMGDAWELKKELARVHRPWLGYLWRVTQVLVWGAAACFLFLLLKDGLEAVPRQWQQNQEALAAGRALYGDGVPDWEGEQLAVYRVDGEARLGRAAVSVSRAARWRERSGDCLYLRLRITWDRLWETNSMAIGCLWAEDDLGNTYKLGLCRSAPEGLGWHQWDLALEGFPPEAKEVRVHHTMREGLDLAVDLTEEVEP